jgi:hypothetical protein
VIGFAIEAFFWDIDHVLITEPCSAQGVVQMARQVRVLIAGRMGSGLHTSVTADADRRIKLEVRYGKIATIELMPGGAQEPQDAIREALVELIEALQSAVDDPDGIVG